MLDTDVNDCQYHVFEAYATTDYLRRLGTRDRTLEIQVYKEYLLWGLKYVNNAYFGLFGSLT